MALDLIAGREMLARLMHSEPAEGRVVVMQLAHIDAAVQTLELLAEHRRSGNVVSFPNEVEELLEHYADRFTALAEFLSQIDNPS